MDDDRNPAPVNDFWRRVEDLFHRALEHPADAREELITEQCAGDGAMEREVREILAGYEAQRRVRPAK